jgi:VirE-like protein
MIIQSSAHVSNLSWLDSVQVQRFDRLYDARPSATLSLGAALDAIVQGSYAPQIPHLRRLYAQHGEDAYAAAKRHLPQITFAGTFSPTRARANLTQHSGIVHADLDHLQDLVRTKLALIQDPTVVYGFYSPRGDGLKYGVRVEPVATNDAYRHAWQTVCDAHQARYGVVWDPSGKDVSRLCFASSDAACFVNPEAQLFPVSPPPPAPRPSPVTSSRHWPSPRLETAAQRALERAVTLIERSEPGQQHVARCRASYLLGGYVGSGQLSYDEASAALAEAVQGTAKDQRKALKDIADGLTAGQTRPITTPTRRAGPWHSRALTPRETPTWRKC